MNGAITPGQWIQNETIYLCLHTLMEGSAIIISFLVFCVGWIFYHKSQRRNTARDLSCIKQSEKKRHLSDKIIESMNEGVIVANLQGTIVSTNSAFTRITGYNEQEALGQDISFFISEQHHPDFLDHVWKQLNETGYWQMEMWNIHKDGSIYAADIRVHSIYDDKGQLDSYATIIGDITERKLKEEEMRYLANYDSLTSLPNRQYFQKRFIRAIAEAKRSDHRLAVMFMDFDNFKFVNDSYGHHIGDILLQKFAERVQLVLPDSSDTIARLGGDEFVLFTKIYHKQEAEEVAMEIVEATAKAFLIHDYQIQISTSIGISLYPDDDQDVQTLIRLADEAMYIAKKSGKNNYQFIH